MILRPFQEDGRNEIDAAFLWAQNVLAVYPTGSGKTVLFSNMLERHIGASCAIAHRSELVSQMSLALARYGVRHRIIGPTKIIRWICQLHQMELGACLYDPNAPCAVAGVNTLIRRKDELSGWLQQVTFWVIDEAHHITRENLWGKAVSMFPNARGLGVTATPIRADGKGLGRSAHGVFDHMVVGPSMRDLIDAKPNYLTDYIIYAPPSDLDLSSVNRTASGDLNQKKSSLQVRKSSIMGDVVQHYLRIAPGKIGVTFAPDVSIASEWAQGFRNAGVPAEVVHAKTPDKIRVDVARRLRERSILQVVNVDLYGEGVDIPAIEVVSMGRPTESYALFVQQFGRALRILPGKDRAIIIDHVGNVTRLGKKHGLPDTRVSWTLDARPAGVRGARDPDVIPVRTCTGTEKQPGCTGVYEAFYKICPYCGVPWEPADRSSPEQVDGDLEELDAAVLAELRGEIAKIDVAPDIIYDRMKNHGGVVAGGAAKQHRKRQEAQAVLRKSMALWGGYQEYFGRPTAESQTRFYFKFGIDVMKAQAIGRKGAEELNERVADDINKLQEVVAV